jgi:hypothetical protein
LQNENNNLLSNNIYEIAMNYSTIEQNKKEYSKHKNTPLNENKKPTINNIPQKQDIIQQLLNSKIFTLEEITSMSIDKLQRVYNLLQNIKK